MFYAHIHHVVDEIGGMQCAVSVVAEGGADMTSVGV